MVICVLHTKAASIMFPCRVMEHWTDTQMSEMPQCKLHLCGVDLSPHRLFSHNIQPNNIHTNIMHIHLQMFIKKINSWRIKSPLTHSKDCVALDKWIHYISVFDERLCVAEINRDFHIAGGSSICWPSSII